MGGRAAGIVSCARVYLWKVNIKITSKTTPGKVEVADFLALPIPLGVRKVKERHKGKK